MDKNVIVSMVGLQLNEDMEPDVMELITEGTYVKKGASHYISFQESEATGMDGTTTTLKASGDVLTLTRFGSVNSQFIFQRGKKHLSYYDTNFGAFTIGITADNVKIDIGEHAGNIRIGYEMAVDGGQRVYNDIFLEFRESGR